MNEFILKWTKSESFSGILLMFAAIMALFVANSPLQSYYALFLDVPVEIRVANLEIAKPLLLWINDGLMAIFFFLVGLELKRELLQGELSDPKNIVLPAMGALGGMVVPALIYLLFNSEDSVAIKGWAIPAATDIAFALGILYLVGSRVPVSLKIFLTSLAIFDDIGAIIIIAIFYTAKISAVSLLVAAVCIVLLFLVNKAGMEKKSVYFMLGLVMWVATLKSGVHATLAGVVLAMFIPMKSHENDTSPVEALENDLHPLVAYFILPLFAFANAGVAISGDIVEHITHSVPLGIALGLFVGKQLGVFLFCFLTIRFGFSVLPSGVNWWSLYGVSALCGVGFTMSRFIGSLAFEETGVNLLFDERIGVIIGSLASGLLGYFILRNSLSQRS